MTQIPKRLAAAGILLSCISASGVPQKASHPSATTFHSSGALTRAQKNGLFLLRKAQVDATAFTAGMRAAILWQVGDSLRHFDKSEAVTTLHDAFIATRDMEADDPDRSFFQGHILETLLKLNETLALDLSEYADARVRQQLLGIAAIQASHAGRYDEAIEKLTRVAAEEGNFPYNALGEVLQRVPFDRSSDRQRLFALGLRRYQRVHSREQQFGDFDQLVVRFWQQLPPGMVLEAISALLSKVNDSTEEGLTLTSANGTVSFTSLYQYRVFEILPILRKIDPAQAERLLRDNPQLQSSIEKFPEGLQSIDPTIRSTPLNGQEHPTLRITHVREETRGRLPDRSAQIRAQYEVEVARILDSAREHPRDALATLQILPTDAADSYPRCQGLEELARRTAKSAPSVAREALDALVKAVQANPTVDSSAYLLDAIDLYLRIGERDAAAATVKQTLKVAEQLCQRDKATDDPNTALKAYWPSTSVWRSLVVLSSRVSSQMPLQIIHDIQDEEIRAVERVAYARVLLGEPPLLNMVRVARREEDSTYVLNIPQ